jgi:hypothetical protein
MNELFTKTVAVLTAINKENLRPAFDYYWL